MKIVVVGAGAVGYHLARELSAEGHAMALIDLDEEKLEHLRDRLDVLTVAGSGTSRATLEAAGTPGADLFIAVSSHDEVNIIACAAARGLGVERTVARVRNPDFSDEAHSLIDATRVGVTRFINPDETAVDTIVALVNSPGSIDVGDFAGGSVLLRSFDVESWMRVTGRPLERLREDFAGEQFVVAAIRRGEEILIPHGHDSLAPGDRAYMLMSRASLPVYRRVVAEGENVQRVVVYGADRLGVAVAARLAERTTVVLIDEDEERCERAAGRLEHAVVLHGSPNDADVLGQSRLATADFFIAAGRNEEHNLILALLAKQRGARRNIVLTADPDLAILLSRLDIDAVVNPRLTMVGRLLRFARGGRVVTVQKLLDSQAEIVEMVVRGGARAVGKTLRDLHPPQGVLLGALQRRGESFVPHGRTVIEEGDVAVVFVAPGQRAAAERLFARRRALHFADPEPGPADGA